MISKLRTISFARANQGFTLVESLVAIVIVTMVASAGAVGVSLSVAAQEDARLAQLAMQAAQQQVSFLMEKPFASMVDYAGTEEPGQLKAPLDAGAVERTKVLAGEWAKLKRITTLTSEPTTFTQYNNFVVDGMRIDVQVQVQTPDGNMTTYATIRRHRTNEDSL